MNLERPLLATGRLHGHVVQGHVDGTGEFLGLDVLGDNNYWLRIRIPEDSIATSCTKDRLRSTVSV